MVLLVAKLIEVWHQQFDSVEKVLTISNNSPFIYMNDIMHKTKSYSLLFVSFLISPHNSMCSRCEKIEMNSKCVFCRFHILMVRRDVKCASRKWNVKQSAYAISYVEYHKNVWTTWMRVNLQHTTVRMNAIFSS